jgi:hypothetical protein
MHYPVDSSLGSGRLKVTPGDLPTNQAAADAKLSKAEYKNRLFLGQIRLGENTISLLRATVLALLRCSWRSLLKYL